MYKRMICPLLALLLWSNSVSADPWFTGPLLAPAGITVPKGHVNLEIYGFDTKNIGIFNRHWKLVHTPATQSRQVNPLLSYGLTDRVDVQVSVPYVVNSGFGRTYHHIGDSLGLLGFQVMRQGDERLRPNLRFTIQQTIPTGKFQQLNPVNGGTEGTGSGSYQTGFALNFQNLQQINDTNYLRTRMIISYIYASPVRVRGLNAYGGNEFTKGSVQPGNLFGFDLSGELTITKHWVAVMEGYYFARGSTVFSGTTGPAVNGVVPTIGHTSAEEVSLAPAIEYNFNEHYGIIGGMWYAISGKNAGDFRSAVIAFNAYW